MCGCGTPKRAGLRLCAVEPSNWNRLSTVFGSVTGRRYEFPDGSLYEIVTPGAATSGARVEMRVTLPPAPVSPRPHVHPAQQETWIVEMGVLEGIVGDERRSLSAGDSLTIPAGTVHTFRNRSSENVTFRTIHTPALQLERYLERLYWLSAMNRVRDTRSVTSLLYLSLLQHTHREDQLPVGPRRLAMPVLARVARALRLRIDREATASPRRG